MDYLGKKKLRPYKHEIKLIINDLKVEMGSEWQFYYYLVESGRRNMAIESNEGFDLDYHLILRKHPDGLNAEEIKRAFMDALDNVTPKHLSHSKDSTHVITIKCIENEALLYSYDLALMGNSEYSEILKNEKEGGCNGPYHFVQIPDSSSFFAKLSLISGSEIWNDLRDIYLEKKEKQHLVKKDDRIYSFSLLQEATNEVLQKYEVC